MYAHTIFNRVRAPTPKHHADDQFREKFLWGRRPMLQELARRLQNAPDGSLTWVDLGGGTGENVQMMSEILPLSKFKTVYVVDLCKALCEVAQAKVDAKGWTNVRVVEADACTFKPDEARVTLVTFSYSLSSTWVAVDGK